MYREIIAVCCQIDTKHINRLCGQNVELMNVKLVVHIVTTGLQRVNIRYTQIQSVPRRKLYISVIKTSQLMLYREIIAVCSQIDTKHINRLCGQNVELLNVKLVVHIVTTGLQRVNIRYTQIQSVPRSKHCISVIKTSQLMLYREIVAVCSQIHTKHINTLCGQNVELLNVKPRGTYSNHWALKG